MAFFPLTIVQNKVRHLSAKYDIPPETLVGLFGELLESLHEATFKGCSTDALNSVYFSLGDEAAWHFWGLIYLSLQGGREDVQGGSRSDWLETAQRLDSRMSRFACILDRWSEEQSFELKQQELDAKDRKND